MRSRRSAASIPPIPEPGADRATRRRLRRWASTARRSRAGTGRPERRTNRSAIASTEPGDREAAPAASLSLEPQHDGEAAHDHDPGGDGARQAQVEVEAVAREQVAGERCRSRSRARRGSRSARPTGRKRSGAPRAGARRQREHERGDPDRHRRRDRELAREEREGRGRDRRPPGRARPTNTDFVTKSWATRWMLRRIWRPSRDHARDDRRSRSRTRTRSATVRAICAPEPCAIASRACLQRGDVVDAVADHRHVAAGGGERVDDRALPVRARCGRPRAPQHRLAQLLRVGRAAPRRRAAAPIPGTPASRAIAPTVAGASPERTFSSTSCSAKNATVSAAFGRSRSARTTRPSARTSAGNGGSRFGRRQRRRRRGRARAPAAPRSPRGALLDQLRVRARRSAPARRGRGARRRDRARSSAAGTRTAPARHRPCLGLRQAGVRDRLQGQVARGGARGVGRDRLRQLALVDSLRGDQADHAQRRLGQRAGLVGADDVHRGQRLDRVELLREHPALRDLEGRDRRGQADRGGSVPRGRG